MEFGAEIRQKISLSWIFTLFVGFVGYAHTLAQVCAGLAKGLYSPDVSGTPYSGPPMLVVPRSPVDELPLEPLSVPPLDVLGPGSVVAPTPYAGSGPGPVVGSTSVVVPDAVVVGVVLVDPAVIVAELAPVSSVSSSAGHAVRLRPISTAPAVRATTPPLRRLPPQ